ncbi:MAG: serine/threonine-protein phosphatase [Spongiibacteraceae bacterium]|nr:serine/threonine-protein phosphatase [Spongiibacteraceae bacterium]
MTVIEFDAKTHAGLVRDHNEDQIFGSGDSRLWMVVDGMGGHACGEVASEIVVRKLSDSYTQGESLASSIELAHTAVTQEAEKNTKAQGMGATVVVMTSKDNRYDIAWVGDSRAYRLRGESLELLTRDHSYLEWLKDNGITIEEAREHPRRNVVTQSVGVGEPKPDYITGRFQSGDRYLLCSDGLNDELSDDEICVALCSAGSSACVTQALIDAALDKGGRDNVSVVVVDIDPLCRNRLFYFKWWCYLKGRFKSKMKNKVSTGR